MLGIDLMGAYTTTNKGNKYIFTCTDYFTKWVEAYPIPDKTAKEVTQCLVKLFCRHGSPEKVLTDRGREFANEVCVYRKSVSLFNTRIRDCLKTKSKMLGKVKTYSN